MKEKPKMMKMKKVETKLERHKQYNKVLKEFKKEIIQCPNELESNQILEQIKVEDKLVTLRSSKNQSKKVCSKYFKTLIIGITKVWF